MYSESVAHPSSADASQPEPVASDLALRGASAEVAVPNSVWVAALLSAAARFAPLPFLDDLIIGRIQRHLVTQALARHGRSYDRRKVAALYEDPEGCLEGCLTWLVKLPLALILFPIRKLWGIVQAVRGFSKDVVDTLLLARCIDRSLARGLLADGSQERWLTSQATIVRRAHFLALGATDLQLLKSSLSQVLSRSGLPRQAQRLLRRVRRQDRDVNSPEALAAQAPELAAGVAELNQVLAQPELVALFVAFDERFDAALAQALHQAQRDLG